MTRISNLPRVTSIDDTGLLVFVNGASEPISIDSGATVSMTFADFKLSVVDQLNTISGPITSTTNAIALFADTTGNLLADSAIIFGVAIGDAITLANVGGSPGLPAVDGSLLTNIAQPDISNLVTGPGSATDATLPVFQGATGKIITQGPAIGVNINNVPILIDVGGGTPGFDVIDGSQLINLPGVITTTPGTTVIANITTWGDTGGSELLDSTVPVSQIIGNTSNISDNQNDIAVNKANITINADDILTKLDKSTNDGIFYGQKNGAIFVPNTVEVDDSVDRRYVLDSDLAKLANVPANTSGEIGTKQDRSPVDAVLYGLLDSILEPITIAVIPGLTAALAGKQDISPVDGVTYGLKDGTIIALTLGSGDVVGPASSINNGIVLFNGLTGKIIKDSTVLFGVSITNALQVADVGGQPGLPALDGSLLTNLPSQPIENLQVTYDASTQPQINIDASGSLQLREGLNVGTNLILEGLNFASTTTFSLDGDGTLTATELTTGVNFTVDTSGTVVAGSFNGVFLSTSAGGRKFLSGSGIYAEVAIYQRFSFGADTTDSDPGSGLFKYNNAAAASTTFIFMSKFQNGGLDISSSLLAGLNELNITDREDPTVAHLFAVTGAVTDATGYVKIPVTLTATAGSEMTVNGDISINLFLSAGGATQDLQGAYSFSTQPQIVIDILGSLQLKEGLNDGTNLIFEGLNFADATTFSVNGNGVVIGASFNGVVLTTAGNARSFLAEDGNYSKIETINQYFFNDGITDVDPGSGQFSYNTANPALVTEIFISKLNGGGLDVSSRLTALTDPDEMNFSGRGDNAKAQIFNLTGLITDNTTYFTIPVTVVQTVGAIYVDGDEINVGVNEEPSLQKAIDLEASSKILEGGIVTIDSPGIPVGESFSITSGSVRIISSNGNHSDLNFPAVSGALFTETGEVARLFINSVGALIQRDSALPADFRLSALLGIIARDTAGQLTFGEKLPQPNYQSWAQFSDLANFISGAADASSRIDSGAADTSFQRFAGSGFVYLGNILTDINNPHIVSMTAANPSTFRVYLFDGTIESVIYSGLGTDTLIDPTVFDDLGGSLVTIPGSPQMSQIFRVFWQPTIQEIRIIHGQVVFGSIADGLNALATYFPIIPSNVQQGSVDLGGFIVRKGASDFTSTGDAIFFRSSEIAGGGGGSVAQNLDETYLNSTPALITINAVQSEFIIQDGTDTDQALLDVKDFSAVSQFKINAETGVSIVSNLDAARTGVKSMVGPIVSASATQVDIPAGTGQIVNGYDAYGVITATAVSWLESLLFTIPNLGVDVETYIFVDVAGVIQTQNTAPTEVQRAANIFLGGTFNDIGNTNIQSVFNNPDITGNTGNSFRSINNFIGNLEQGGTITQTGDTGTNGLLAIAIGAVSSFATGTNWHTSKVNPDVLGQIAIDPGVFAYIDQDGDLFSQAQTLIDVNTYDNAGTPTAVPSGNSTIQYLFQMTDGSVNIMLGQTLYVDFNAATNALDLDRSQRVTPDVLFQFGYELAALVLDESALDLADNTKVLIVQTDSIAQGGTTPVVTTFKGLTDTPSSAGTVNTLLQWDVVGDLVNTTITSFTSAGGSGGWYLNDASIAGTGSLFFGFFTNNTQSNTTGSCFLGTNSGNKLGDNNNNITLIGTQALNSIIADGVLNSITGVGQTAFQQLSSGNNVVGIGKGVCRDVTNATNSVIIMGMNSVNTTTSLATCGIYGHVALAPAGAVLNYLNFHNTIQANSLTKTVTIGDTINTKPANTDHSLELSSDDQVLGLNAINDTAEGTVTEVLADFWFNSTSNDLKYFDTSIKTITSQDATFVNADLTTGVLTITHNRGRKLVTVVIGDNNDLEIAPDSITFTSTSVVTIDLTTQGTLTGTWNYSVR